MPKRITALTSEQKERMATFAQEWVERGWRTRPLTEEEWQVQAEGMRRSYEYAGILWHGNVVRVPSPLVGARAAPIAAALISLRKHGAVDAAVYGAVHDAVGGAVGGAVYGAVYDAVDVAVRGAVGNAVHGAVGGAVCGAVGDAVGDAVRGAVYDAVRGAVGSAVGSAVDNAVDAAVHHAVYDAVRGAVGDAVRGAVGSAVHNAVDAAVHNAVDAAVDDAVDGAVGGAVRQSLQPLWHCRLGGRLWLWWQSYIAYFRDVAELQLDGDLWDRSRAYEDAQSAGWWWPFRDFAIVCDVPTVLHLEQVGPAGWGSHRLHCETGPAVAWGDGWGLHYWHGTQVPADLIEDGWDAERILREPNAEVRRCAIERAGWDRFIEEARLSQVGDSVPDPGNPGHQLALYDVPARIFDEPVRVLLCTNASVERDGTRRRFGLTVPASIKDPLAAAAWTFGVERDTYAALQRAC